MRPTTSLLLAAVCAAAAIAVPHAPALADDATGAVNDARLLAAPGDGTNWLTAGDGYADRHFSPLAQIDRTNVASLRSAWTFHTGVRGGFEATPLVDDGTMFVTTTGDDVFALDAATGARRWRYAHVLQHKPCCGAANRGAAVAYGRVYVATADARLVALDRSTGAVAWDVPITAEPGGAVERRAQLAAGDALAKQGVIGESGLFANMAPLAVNGTIVVGVTGVGYGLHLGSDDAKNADTAGVVGIAGEYGHRGFYVAYDAATGREVWRWYTVPPRGWEGDYAATTPGGTPLHRDLAAERASAPKFPNAWRTGGGSAWTTPAYDPALGLLYVGVGNPSPQFADETRPGDNRWTVALVALDAKTGAFRWGFQEVPHDLWGYDVASPPVLFDATIDGARVPVVAQASKTGWLYVLDRRTGKLLRRSQPFVTQTNLFARPDAAGITIAPGAFGGASWSPAAYDASTGLAYVDGINIPMTYRLLTSTEKDGSLLNYTEATPVAPSGRSGTLTAIDAASGAIRWQHVTPQPMMGGTLATAGGLVFAGEGDGDFDAFDAASGARLWHATGDAGVNAPPIAYRAGGREYVAVAAGGNALLGLPQGDTLDVYALP